MKTFRHFAIAAAVALAAMPYHQAAEAISIGGRAAPAPAARPAAPVARPAPAPAPAARPAPGGISGRQSVGVQPSPPPAPPKPAATMPPQQVQQATRTATTPAPAPAPAPVAAPVTSTGSTTVIERDRRDRSGPGWGTVAAAGVGGALLGHVMTDKQPVVAGGGGGYAAATGVAAAPAVAADPGTLAAAPAAAGGYVVAAPRSNTAVAGDWFFATVFWMLTAAMLVFIGVMGWKLWKSHKAQKDAAAFDYTQAFFDIQSAFAMADRARLSRLLGPGMREKMNPTHEPTTCDVRGVYSYVKSRGDGRMSVAFHFECDGVEQEELWHFERLADGWRLQGITYVGA